MSARVVLRLTYVALAAAGLATRAQAAEGPCATPVVASDGVEVATPESTGFDAAALCTALREVARGSANVHGALVERHGRLVAELYRDGLDRPIDEHYGVHLFASHVHFAANVLHDVRSISKSVISLLFGIARSDGRIPELGTPVLTLFPELADLRSPERDRVTLEHLLTMSSGLAWDEWDAGPLTSDETRLFWKADPARFLFDRPFAAPPGTRFEYDGGGTATLAEILVRASGKPLDELAREQLFEPLGITHWVWARDLRDRPLAFAGLRLRPRDMVKLGRLVLDGGRWRGRQVVPEAWVAESLRSHISTGMPIPPGAPENVGYGYQWWTGRTAWKDRRVSWSAGFGNGGQRIFVVPELDLVVVATAGDYGMREIAGTVAHIFQQVVAAVAE